MKRVRILVGILFVCVVMGGCGVDPVKTEKVGYGGDSKKGSVFFLNFKPEAKKAWEIISKDFTKETGIDVRVETAASGTYEKTLKSYIGSQEYPTLFQVNGTVGLSRWKDYCADLSNTFLYKWLVDKTLAVGEDQKILGIPYTVEGYGIIYNESIIKRYFALKNRDKSIGINDSKGIKSFAQLDKIVDDMTKHKSQLAILGVFASTSLAAGNQWRWQTHLASVPIYYEYQDKKVNTLSEIAFTYSENMKQVFDMYIDNSTTPRENLAKMTVSNSIEEFAKGQCAMIQNGNWAWSEIEGVPNRTVQSDQVKMMPLYIGVGDEKSQGLCIGTENYWCINSYVTPDDQAATLEFIQWVVDSEQGKKYAIEQLGFLMPFATFDSKDTPSNPLARAVISDLRNSDLVDIPWSFTSFPGEEFKDAFGEALVLYAQGKRSWSDVKNTVCKEWKDNTK